MGFVLRRWGVLFGLTYVTLRCNSVNDRLELGQMLSQPVAADFCACSKFAWVRKYSLGHSASVRVSPRHHWVSVRLIFGQCALLSDAVGWWLTDIDADCRNPVKWGYNKEDRGEQQNGPKWSKSSASLCDSLKFSDRP